MTKEGEKGTKEVKISDNLIYQGFVVPSGMEELGAEDARGSELERYKVLQIQSMERLQLLVMTYLRYDCAVGDFGRMANKTTGSKEFRVM